MMEQRKKKNKIWKNGKNRICAFVCALVMVFGCLGGAVPVKAATISNLNEFLTIAGLPIFDGYDESYTYYLYSGFDSSKPDNVAVYLTAVYGSYSLYADGSNGICNLNSSSSKYMLYMLNDSGWTLSYSRSGVTTLNFGWGCAQSDMPIYYFDKEVYSKSGELVFLSGFKLLNEDAADQIYSSSVGYLQNLTSDTYYLQMSDNDFNTDDTSQREIWKFSKETTTGIDLTSGDYTIRHYIQPVLCENYDESGVIEKYDMYLMGEYDAANLRIEYKQTDYAYKLEEYGHKNTSVTDFLLGRFQLHWQYFQIVNNETGEYGGYVVMKPVGDSTFDSVTTTPDGEKDPTGYDGIKIENNVSHGLTYEQAEHNAIAKREESSGDAVDGSGLVDTMNTSISTVQAIPTLLASIFSFLPDWCLNMFGASVGLAALIILWKVARG